MLDKRKQKLPCFNGNEWAQFQNAMEKMYLTQHGALQETLTGEELVRLFVPPEFRKGLMLVYEIEETSRARGEIWIDVTRMIKTRIFDDAAARAEITKATVRVYFHRDFVKDGFVTPTPLFGTRQSPITLGPATNDVEGKFADNVELLVQITAEWTMVRWAAAQLQNSLRTPQQMRYVWPATYNIAQAAGLKMDLSTPSSRAGINAIPAPVVRPFLRETNDVVARSTLMGVNNEYITRYNRKDIVVANLAITVEGEPSQVFFSANV